ncbi:rhamnan synthesis F family protein [bacterium]|nr:rhamnan synthesis F family protein [bacterium]
MDIFNKAFLGNSKKALCIHLYYTEVADEIYRQPGLKKEQVDFYISLGTQVDSEFFKNLEFLKGRVKIYQFANCGRDVYPFLKIYPDLLKYEWVCKLHSKRSPQIRDGELWRQDLFSDLLSDKTWDLIRKAPNDARIFASQKSLLPVSIFLGGNGSRMKELFKKMHISKDNFDFLFVAGTMFWFRPKALHKLQLLGDPDLLFESEVSRIDGLTAHAFERLFYFLATETSSDESFESNHHGFGTSE